jgi:ABC-type sugar transport system permease subunit
VAKVEGASAWVAFWKITLPMIAPTILVNLVYTIIDNFINYSNDMFKLIQEVTGKIQFDTAAAMANICFLVISLLIVIVYGMINKHIYYVVD